MKVGGGAAFILHPSAFILCREVVDGCAALGVRLSPKLHQRPRPVAGGADGPEGIVPAVEEVRHAGEPADFREDVLEILALGEAGMFAEEDDLLVARPPDARRIRPGEMEGLDEGVVLQEADEDARKHPGDGDIGQLLLAPRLVGERSALARACGVVLRFERGVGSRLGVAAGAEVGVEAGDFALEVGEEFG